MDSPIIKIALQHSIKINYTMCATGDTGTAVSTNGKFLLALGRLYEIPTQFENNILLDDVNVIKLYGKWAEKIDVKNIRDGKMIVQAIIHNTILIHNDEIGILI